MTLAEYTKKWDNLYTEHNDGCRKKFSMDYNDCSCGHDILWEMRNADLATVPEEELAAYRRERFGTKTAER